MKISIGSDRDGYMLKQAIKEYLHSLKLINKLDLNDWGCYDNKNNIQKDCIDLISNDVNNNTCLFGIIILSDFNHCSIVSNKYYNVRASVCWTENNAYKARLNSDSNILILPSDFVSLDDAIKCLSIFMTTNFGGHFTENNNTKHEK